MRYIMKIQPAFKDYLWGGTRLKTEWGKKTDLAKVAESWELSCHPDGLSTVENGPAAGQTLAAFLAQAGPEALGTNCAAFDRFPVLIKLIDAKQNLSVQVHPNNDYAMRVEGEPGKTEMWYVVDCEPGAQLIYGFDHEISKEEFAQRIQNQTLLEVVHAVPVHKGDVFFIESGTLHGIGAGTLIAEIQQNSNTTYRVYDYGRVGTDGKPRTLHIDKALDVTHRGPARYPVTQGSPEACDGYADRLLASCSYFTVHALDIYGEAHFAADRDSFHSLLCTECTGTLTVSCAENSVTMRRGDSVFLPAGLGDYTVTGVGRVLRTTV